MLSDFKVYGKNYVLTLCKILENKFLRHTFTSIFRQLLILQAFLFAVKKFDIDILSDLYVLMSPAPKNLN